MTSDSRPGVAYTTDALDRRIICALQIDGRASWLRISRVLGENERTVARRGSRLLESGIVRVAGIQLKAKGTVLALRCGPGHIRMASRAVGARPETMWAHMVAGDHDIVAEASYGRSREAAFLLEELPAVAGIREGSAYPVLRYLRTAHQWRPGLLTDDEHAELEAGVPGGQRLAAGGLAGLSPSDRIMHSALLENGRRSYDELARLAGVSEATASRRVEHMRNHGHLAVRAVVDPAVLGLPVEALVWVKAAPSRVGPLADAITQASRIRYASRITGPHQVLMVAAVASREELDDFVSGSEWCAHADAVEVSTVVATGKRGGLLSDGTS